MSSFFIMQKFIFLLSCLHEEENIKQTTNIFNIPLIH